MQASSVSTQSTLPGSKIVVVVPVAEVDVEMTEHPSNVGLSSSAAKMMLFSCGGVSAQLTTLSAFVKNGPMSHTTCTLSRSSLSMYRLIAVVNAAALSSHAWTFPDTSKKKSSASFGDGLLQTISDSGNSAGLPSAERHCDDKACKNADCCSHGPPETPKKRPPRPPNLLHCSLGTCGVVVGVVVVIQVSHKRGHSERTISYVAQNSL